MSCGGLLETRTTAEGQENRVTQHRIREKRDGCSSFSWCDLTGHGKGGNILQLRCLVQLSSGWTALKDGPLYNHPLCSHPLSPPSALQP